MGLQRGWIETVAERAWNGGPERVRVLYAKPCVEKLLWYPSRPGHVESRLNLGGPSSKAKYELVTDSGEYREGKVKRTPDGE